MTCWFLINMNLLIVCLVWNNKEEKKLLRNENLYSFAQKYFMRKNLFSLLIVIVLLVAASNVSAQRSANGSDYRNAIGLGIDFGDGATLVGPSFKHFFTDEHVGKFEVLFGDNYSFLQGFYEYHREIDGAAGLRWFAGIGAGAAIAENNSAFLLRPEGGLDYKIEGAPLSFSFDWRPTFFIGDDSDFEPARFGLGIRFCFN